MVAADNAGDGVGGGCGGGIAAGGGGVEGAVAGEGSAVEHGGGGGNEGGCEKRRVRTRSIGLMVTVTWRRRVAQGAQGGWARRGAAKGCRWVPRVPVDAEGAAGDEEERVGRTHPEFV